MAFETRNGYLILAWVDPVAKKEHTTEGGIVIPGSEIQIETVTSPVISCTPDNEHGIVNGDIILFKRAAAQSIQVGEDKHLALSSDAVIGVFKE